MRAASSLRRSLRRAIALLVKGEIVARRYVGALGGSAGREPLVLFYLGREAFAREFEVYFRQDARQGVAPPETLFQGSLPQFLVHRARLAREALAADLLAREAFPGSPADADDLPHYPMLQGSLRVEPSIERQVRRMRSRTQRRLARALLRSGGYRHWIDPSLEALERFRVSLHEPYVQRRFGPWGFLNKPEDLRKLFRSKGYLLFVAEEADPDEPVAAAMLLDTSPGVLFYYINGFADSSCDDQVVNAERTAALELALLKHAIERKVQRIDLGYSRAILSDGLFTHKRRLGAEFAPVTGSPLFRVRVRPTRRAAVFARFPLLVGGPGQWRAVLGFDDTAPRATKKGHRGVFRSYAPLGLLGATVWSNTTSERAQDPLGEAGFRSALAEALDLPEGVEFLTDRELPESST